MDMKVDSQKLIQLRNAKAWSQQHLADVSGLSLRTIQRIEKTQSASHDLIGALASVFETTPDALLMNVGILLNNPIDMSKSYLNAVFPLSIDSNCSKLNSKALKMAKGRYQ